MLFFMIIFGVFTLASAIGVVFSKRSLHSALCLITTMFFIAVHFALLRADFLAAMQIMIYAGAIMVLVVFVIMLLGIDEDVESKSFAIPRIFGFLFALSFAGLIAYGAHSESVVKLADSFYSHSFATSVDRARQANEISSVEVGTETAAGVGRLLLTDYFFAFQAIALLLLAAIVGAVVLAQDKVRPLAKDRGLRAMHARVEE